ncbi:ABC-three component system protein [Methylobacterium sp. GC_Met_2]|uniref:ABC-three component system protein n=1 Tax=Methylobacterium sp. GC_Met_2 TaxID=2937376 RepID=UPI00226AFE74|nr:ABC-three component system protein [Methylobacterium sp. GC_Met_2]
MHSLNTALLNLPFTDLEILMYRWALDLPHRYHSAERVGQAMDRGLDVVAFSTPQRFEGPWDNYQCKQLRRTLGEPSLFGEVGKTLYYASRGEFTPPAAYVFIAPYGVAQSARVYLGQPSRFRRTMLDEWDKRCAKQIAKGTAVAMDDQLRSTIEAYDFGRIDGWNADRILAQESMQAVLVKTFEIDPGSALERPVPGEFQEHEATYVDQLVGVYGEHSGLIFSDADAVLGHEEHGVHLRDQRVRYFAAADFKAHFKESVLETLLTDLDDNIYHGVVDGLRSRKGLDRVDAAMSQAAVLAVPGPFGKHNRATIKVRQGTCHHLVNAGRLRWRP